MSSPFDERVSRLQQAVLSKDRLLSEQRRELNAMHARVNELETIIHAHGMDATTQSSLLAR
jgi:hypothetical protein